MLWVGIDTHLRMHWIEVQNDPGKVMWKGRTANTREGFTSLVEKMRQIERSNSQPVSAIFMNPTGNYHAPLKSFMESQGYRVILVDARISDHIRMMRNLGKEKSDGVNASILASTRRLMPSILDRGNHERSDLSGLTRLAEMLKNNITRITNQVKSDLAAVFPEYPYYEDVDSKTSLEILERFTTPEILRNSSPDDIAAILKSASRGHFNREDANNLMKLAINSIGIPDPDGIYAYRIRVNAGRIREENKTLCNVKKEIEKRSSGNMDIDHITAIKGIGTQSAATIVSEIGDISQFPSAMKLQSYGGKSPNMSGSGGKTMATGVSKIRNQHLSNAVYECAVSLVMHKTQEFTEIFNREILKGKKPAQAYIVVGKRLPYHIYSIMKNHKPYKERSHREGGKLPMEG